MPITTRKSRSKARRRQAKREWTETSEKRPKHRWQKLLVKRQNLAWGFRGRRGGKRLPDED